MYAVDLQNESHYPLDDARLVQAIAATLERYHVVDSTALSVVFTGDEQVAELNRTYRGVDSPTDILSFPADEPPIAIPGEPPYLGDLVIAYPYASAQAKREGHTLSDSLTLLIVHGTLHLLGFDHDTPETRRQMWTAQEDLLALLGVPPGVLPALEGDPSDEEAH